MKKDVFSSWLKEFCSLVFTQTVQAFLLAIIMSVVIYMASDSKNAGDKVSATSVIAIIAISSVSKIELLVKRIFGVESQFGDPAMKNGAKSFLGGIAGGYATIQLGKKLLDNPKKIFGGAKDMIQSNRQIRKINLRKARDFDNLDRQWSESNNKNTTTTTLPTNSSGSDSAQSTIPNISRAYNVDPLSGFNENGMLPEYEGPSLSKYMGNGDGFSHDKNTNPLDYNREKLRAWTESINRDYPSGPPGTTNANRNVGTNENVIGNPQSVNIGAATFNSSTLGQGNIQTVSSMSTSGNVGQISSATLNNNNVSNVNANNVNANGADGKSKKMSQAEWESKKNALSDKYDDLLADAKSKRGKAAVSTLSGIAETVAAPVAGIGYSGIRTVIDAAQGDFSLKESIGHAIKGAGAADAVTEATVALGNGVADAIKIASSAPKQHETKIKTIETITNIETRHGDDRTDSGIGKYHKSIDYLNSYAKSKEAASSKQIRTKPTAGNY